MAGCSSRRASVAGECSECRTPSRGWRNQSLWQGGAKSRPIRDSSESFRVIVADQDARTRLDNHRRVWSEKPALQRIYREEFFSRLMANCGPGPTVEIGAGPGFLKQCYPNVISTDLVTSSWLDVVADAQHLPFESGQLANVVGLDVLHHVERPLQFLTEAVRVLAPGGRLVLVEPWVTPVSYVIYRYLHQEDCDLKASVFGDTAANSRGPKKAFDGNQAIPYLLFGPRTLAPTIARVPEFAPVKIEPFCFFAYLLSLGFKRLTLLPSALYPFVSGIEKRTLHLWRSAAALRVLLVLEKRHAL